MGIRSLETHLPFLPIETSLKARCELLLVAQGALAGCMFPQVAQYDIPIERIEHIPPIPKDIEPEGLQEAAYIPTICTKPEDLPQDKRERRFSDYETRQLTAIVNRLGLFSCEGRREEFKEYKMLPAELKIRYVAKDKRTAQQLAATEEMENRYPHQLAIMGYPTTSIEAIINGTMHPTDLPKDAYTFFRFFPFSTHWKEELAIVHQWGEIVRKNSPALYLKTLAYQEYKEKYASANAHRFDLV